MPVAGADLSPGVRNANNRLGKVCIGHTNRFEVRARYRTIGAFNKGAAVGVETFHRLRAVTVGHGAILCI